METMNLDLLAMQEFITKYKLEQITSSRIFASKNEINPLGLFSNTIFGDFGSKERMETFAFINLGTKVLHPMVYHMFTKMSKKVNDVICGINYYRLEEQVSLIKGEKTRRYLVLDNKNGTLTGIELIYNYFDEFLEEFFKETGTKTRNKYLDFLRTFQKDEMFTDKFLVIPAGLRDINIMDFDANGTVSYEPINDNYLSLLRATEALVASASMEFTNKFNIVYTIQNQLLELYLFLTNSLAGKSGLIQSKSLKRPIAYAVRSVIATPNKITNKHNEDLTTNVRLGQVGIPVTIMLDQFYPFVIHELTNFYKNTTRTFFKDFINIEFKDKIDTLTDTQLIELFVDKCIGDKYFLNKVMGEIDKKYPIYVMDFLKNEILMNIVGTPKEPKRFVTGTRYPITGQFSVQIFQALPYTTDKVKLITTESGLSWELSINPELYSLSIRLNDLSLAPYGGDHDGDMLTFMGIFTDEANAKIKNEKKSYRHKNLTLAMQPQAMMTNEILVGLEFLTRK